MNQTAERFARLLTDAIYEIKKLESKKVAVIQDELGYALGKNGGSSIEHWRKGNLPSKTTDIAQLAREIIRRLPKNQIWLKEYCVITEYPFVEALVEELFPTPDLPINKLPEPGPLPIGSLMPLSKNPFFTGRKWDLRALAKAMRVKKVTAVTQLKIAATTGMGGMGKTQLACEFVHRYGQYFPGGVFWINFEEPNAIPEKIAECGETGRLNLSPRYSQLSLNEKVNLVQNEWQKPTIRLLIFDNCEDQALLQRWIPKTGGCRILITSRRSQWDPVLRVQSLNLEVLYQHESVTLLKQLSTIEDEGVLGDIADELGHLPLALHLAGKYLYQYKSLISPEKYLQELQNPDLLRHRSLKGSGISPTGHNQHVWRTFAISYEKLSTRNKSDMIAHQLLAGAAHFAPGEPIWSRLLIKTLDLPLDQAHSMLLIQDGFSRLLELGLIEVERENIYRMHRLIAAFIQNIARNQVSAILEKVEDVVFEETAKINAEGYPVPLLAWNLHLRSVTDLAKAREDERGARLCQEMGEHLRQTGNFASAFTYFEKTLDIWQKLSTNNEVDVAYCKFKIGHLYREQGDLDKAKPFLDEALDIWQRLLDSQHPQIAACHNEIGRWFYQKNDLITAQKHFEMSVAISESALGSTHRFTAEYLNNLGMCLYMQNELEQAVITLKRALSIRQIALGNRHPETALSFNNVGLLLYRQELFEDAYEHYKQALKIREIVLGEKHSQTGETYNNIGKIMLVQNKLEDVQYYLNKSVIAFEHTFNQLHPSLAYPLRNLGLYWQKHGKNNKARQYFMRALRIRENSLGQKHPLTEMLYQDLQSLKS